MLLLVDRCFSTLFSTFSISFDSPTHLDPPTHTEPPTLLDSPTDTHTLVDIDDYIKNARDRHRDTQTLRDGLIENDSEETDRRTSTETTTYRRTKRRIVSYINIKL